MPFKDKLKKKKYALIYQKKHYESKKQYYIDKARNRKKNIRLRIDEYKKINKCLFCNESESCCLDFHHLKDKEFEISNMVARGLSESKIMLEIRKCLILCSNCHRKVHAGILKILPSIIAVNGGPCQVS